MAKLVYTSAEAIEAKYHGVKEGFHSGITHSLDFRRDQLRNLYYALMDHESELKESLALDLHRPSIETELLEMNLCIKECCTAIAKLDEWAKDTQLPAFSQDVRFAAGTCVLRKTPYGVVLIIGPWNYPVLCTVLPIISAIAAGNTVIFKPTEVCVQTSISLGRILEANLDHRVLQVVQGSIEETTQLLKLKWDKIMLTGSNRVGKIVAHAAAESLTPICLELGGKSPAIVSSSANLKLSAKRIAWSKLVNAGQTCIAPDYIIIDKAVSAEFIGYLKEAIKGLYPDISSSGSGGSRDYAHIITDRLFERAQEIVKTSNAQEKWQWGTPNAKSRFFPPTVLYGGLTVDDSTMKEELFNPILPILEVDNVVTKAPQIVKTYFDHPLSLYIFSSKKAEQEALLTETRSGPVMLNDAIMFGGSSIIPFGGVGASGVGRYHGKFGFDEFTYERPVVATPTWLEKAVKGRYPPYTPWNGAVLRILSRPSSIWFGRTGKVKSKGRGVFWLFGFLIRKLGLTIVILAILNHFS